MTVRFVAVDITVGLHLMFSGISNYTRRKLMLLPIKDTEPEMRNLFFTGFSFEAQTSVSDVCVSTVIGLKVKVLSLWFNQHVSNLNIKLATLFHV